MLLEIQLSPLSKASCLGLWECVSWQLLAVNSFRTAESWLAHGHTLPGKPTSGLWGRGIKGQLFWSNTRQIWWAIFNPELLVELPLKLAFSRSSPLISSSLPLVLIPRILLSKHPVLTACKFILISREPNPWWDVRNGMLLAA